MVEDISTYNHVLTSAKEAITLGGYVLGAVALGTVATYLAAKHWLLPTTESAERTPKGRRNLTKRTHTSSDLLNP
jgi:hypothetical protein